MPTEIKYLRSTDHAAFAHVAPDVFDDELDPAAINEFLNDPRHHLVAALADGVMVGFVSAVHYVHPDKSAPELWINEVGVSEAVRRQGIAQAMLNTMMAVARERGCSVAWVLTNRSNHAAMKLYASVGGHTDDDDVVMFEMQLDDAKITNDNP